MFERLCWKNKVQMTKYRRIISSILQLKNYILQFSSKTDNIWQLPLQVSTYNDQFTSLCYFTFKGKIVLHVHEDTDELLFTKLRLFWRMLSSSG